MADRDRVNYALNAFSGIGLNKEQAFGILGSLAGESGRGLNTRAHNPKDPNGGSFGIGQWHSERRQGLESFAKRSGRPVDDFRTQIDYIVHELQTTEKRALSAVKNAKTRYEAARAWTDKYERPNPKYAHHDKRMKNADYFASLAAGKAKPTTPEKGKSLTGANIKAEPMAYAGTPTPSSRPSATGTVTGEAKKGGLDAIGDMLNDVAGATGLGTATGAGKKEQETNPVSGGIFGGDVTTGAVIGSLAGGMIAGPMGAMAGGFLGQGISRALDNVGRTAGNPGAAGTGFGGTGLGQFDIGGGISRAIGGLLSSFGGVGGRGTVNPELSIDGGYRNAPTFGSGSGSGSWDSSLSPAANEARDQGKTGLY